MKYHPVIGLEIHVQLTTKSKMFCFCPNDSDERKPNVNICPICLGHPGTLPTINREAVKKVIKTGLALNSQIAKYSCFDRKSYFYPDLPKGYQISQYQFPLCQGGFLEINGKKIRIRRIHLEEDTGKLIHSEKGDYSLVDFNRAGVPLMELVTEPDLKSASETRLFVQELHLLFHYLNISDADMEKGQMRVEVNISLSRNEKSGIKVEIKNLNSFRSVQKSIEYEIERQTNVLKAGKRVVQETRGWDEKKEITITQREKEEAHDYRYFPEPDLPSFNFNQSFVDEIKSQIPELPWEKRERFKKTYGLAEKSINFFVYNKALGEYYEKVMFQLEQSIKTTIKKEEEKKEYLKLAKLCANYIITDLQGLLKDKFGLDRNILITPRNFSEFILLIYGGKISSKMAKDILSQMFSKNVSVSYIIKKEQLVQITDELELEKIVKQVIEQNQKAVEDYKKGKRTAFQFLVGQVMKVTKGRAKPDLAQKLLQKLLY